MGGASPPPVIERLDEIVENTAWSSEPIFDWLGVKFRVLCALRNVFAHDVEHVIDPRTGHEVLVLADPHIYRGVKIFDLKEREIVWEYRSPFRVKGTYGIYRATRYSPDYVRPLFRER